eukprot:TRINITY_DN2221_c0_g1_i1.p1 TRINITY_DN2221_c0_g1~~TRINITY_DN2221_c0_g1_i1.p1  ORF type:complete len:358 (+),score=70.12 TRINITY_DN2221_c0_g1_i1:32-1105(+)
MLSSRKLLPPLWKSFSREFSCLNDSFGRFHDYLRISITEKCNFQCQYCMPEGGTPCESSEDEFLTSDEIVRLAKLFVDNGVKKIRLTGGEPLVHPDFPHILKELKSLKSSTGLESLGITTNGLLLDKYLPALKDCGFDSLNISLDTLDPEKFEKITNKPAKMFSKVVGAVDKAYDMGFDSVKVNCVLMKNINDYEAPDFVEELIRDRDISFRFIEYMPFGETVWREAEFLPYQVVVDELSKQYSMSPRNVSKSSTSREYDIEGCKGNIGFISPMTNHFCATCNRVRLTADGQLKVCLFGTDETNLRDMMRSGASDSDIVEVISDALNHKFPALGGHTSVDDLASTKDENRQMSRIGG